MVALTPKCREVVVDPRAAGAWSADPEYNTNMKPIGISRRGCPSIFSGNCRWLSSKQPNL